MNAMRAFLLCILLGSVCLTGCSYVVTGRVVSGPADTSHLRHIDPNDPNCPISIEWIREPNKPARVSIQRRTDIPEPNIVKDSYRIAYADSSSSPRSRAKILFNGTLGHSDKEYEFKIDTGSPYPLMVNDLHVLENDLPIYEISPGSLGLCLLPSSQVGSTALRGTVSMYNWYHTEIRLLGLTVYKDRTILLGTPFLQMFNYVVFDGVGREAEFSRTQGFDPPDPNEWSRYRFVESSAPSAKRRILIEIPLAGQTVQVAFDSGYQGTFLTSQKTWQQMQQELSGVKANHKTLYAPHLGGRLSATMATVTCLKVGNRITQNARIAALPDDSPAIKSLEDMQGVLGMQCFADTTIVLDFEREALWVRDRVPQ